LNPDVLFVVIGQQFAPVTHPPNVVFLGAQPYDQMPLYYNLLDVLCSLSVYSYESCPSTVLEGMACGLPVVATRFSGATELLGNCEQLIEVDRFEDEPLNMCGYVDPEAVSGAVRGLLESKVERLELGNQARERAERFSWDRTAKQHVALIKTLIQKRDQGVYPMPVSIHFTQGCAKHAAEARVFNYLGGQQGPLPRIPFHSQDVLFLEGLGMYLSQVLHPNEVEAALLGIVADRELCHKVLRKIRQVGDMMMAP
jgi:hypothetical protein